MLSCRTISAREPFQHNGRAAAPVQSPDGTWSPQKGRLAEELAAPQRDDMSRLRQEAGRRPGQGRLPDADEHAVQTIDEAVRVAVIRDEALADEAGDQAEQAAP